MKNKQNEITSSCIVGTSKFVMHKISSPLSFSRVCLCSSSVCAFVMLISLQTSILTTDSDLSQDAFQPSQYSFTFLAYEHFTTFYELPDSDTFDSILLPYKRILHFFLHFFFRMKISSIITWLLRWENIRQLLLRCSLKYVCSCDVLSPFWNENVLFKKQLPSWVNWNKSKK